MKKSHVRAHILAITQQRSGVRNQNFANQHDALEQLDGVLNSMFELLSEDVEPFIEDSQACMALRSYKSLTQNLLKSLKIQKRNLLR